MYKSVKSTFCSGNNTEILAVMPSKLHLFRAHSDFKSTCIPSFNENSKRLRCTFCYAHAKLNELPETHCKTLFHCGNCNVNLCFSPDRDCFTKWHSTEGARVRAWVKENGRNKDH